MCYTKAKIAKGGGGGTYLWDTTILYASVCGIVCECMRVMIGMCMLVYMCVCECVCV